MKRTQFKFKTFDGLQLFGQSWQPEDRPRAVICLIHGIGEHSGRYVHVADRLTKAGYAIFTFDLRGHGKSEGLLGHTPSYEALMQDISSLKLQIKNLLNYPFFFMVIAWEVIWFLIMFFVVNHILRE